jgi:putative nucleotidyltransferase with HDIG domain
MNPRSATVVGRTVAELLDELERLPAQPTAALRLLWLTDDPSSSSEDLAGVVQGDPALTAKIMRLANSVYYGLSGRVASAQFAVTVLGFSTVRSLAAAAAAGTLEDDHPAPDGFWAHAAATASACALVAGRVGARRPEAFSVGLLHDLGAALLHRCDPAGYDEVLLRMAGGSSLTDAEQAVFGMGHEEVTARVLEAWRFPSEFVEAIAAHHGSPADAGTPLAKALVAGEALALLLEDAPRHEQLALHADALLAANIEEEQVEALLAQVRTEAEQIVPNLQPS